MSTAATTAGQGFGHGKLILLGEHAVVFGQPALAAGIPAGVRASVSPGPGHIRIPAWNVHARIGDGSPVATAVERLLGRLGVQPVDLAVEATLPARAGLGSSAALAVAIARAVAKPEATEAELLAAVAESETIFHGSPSGIDAAAAFFGGVGQFRLDDRWQPVAVQRRIKVCVGLSGKPRDTKTQVESVGRLCGRTPAVRGVIDVIGDVTRAGIAAVELGDIDTLGRLFDVAHGLLASLRVSTPELDALVHAARAAGSIGAKLTGAGGGGAVIALAPSHTRDVLDRWRALGFEGFDTVVGGE